MSVSEEQAYTRGERAVWLSLLHTALRALGRETAEWDAARLIAEREEAIAALRDLCETHGDNDWQSGLHLRDIIEKHLARHLNEGRDDA